MVAPTRNATDRLPLARAALDEHGFAVVDRVGGLDVAAALLSALGVLLPQYDGNITHEVRYRPGNDHRSYSQSANRIQAHTEAPGWNPSPNWLALYCHRQA